MDDQKNNWENATSETDMMGSTRLKMYHSVRFSGATEILAPLALYSSVTEG